jgi:ketosteroid isomerase-like protein
MLRLGYDAANRADWAGVFNDVDPNFELKAPDRMMAAGTYRGSAAVRQFFEDLMEPFEDVQVQPEKFFDSGDRIVVFISLRARPAGSNAVMEIRIGHLWTMRDGKMLQLEIFPERQKALEAVAMSEQDALTEP